MSEQIEKNPAPRKKPAPQTNAAVKPPKKKGSAFGTFVRRFFLCFFTLLILLVAGLAMIMNLVFNGPSPAARNVLTMSLLEPSATKWIPGLFMDKEVVESIRNAGGSEELEDETDTSLVVINRSDSVSTGADEWADYPDGIRIFDHKGKTFDAHVMIIRDPSRVYLGLSTYDGFSTSKSGKRLTDAIVDEGAAAAINAGAFNDNGTSGPEVGSIPAGLTVHGSKVVSNTAHGYMPPDTDNSFCGFNEDDIMVIYKNPPTEAQILEDRIRDGCQFGPILIINGEINQQVYSGNSGYNPRTVIGQRADGAVIFICADGRQAGSLGATYKDMIDILVDYGAVNAYNMDGGSSSVMLYRDTYGRFGEAGEIQMINSYSVLQSKPRRMPDFWMVRPMD